MFAVPPTSSLPFASPKSRETQKELLVFPCSCDVTALDGIFLEEHVNVACLLI